MPTQVKKGRRKKLLPQVNVIANRDGSPPQQIDNNNDNKKQDNNDQDNNSSNKSTTTFNKSASSTSSKSRKRLQRATDAASAHGDSNDISNAETPKTTNQTQSNVAIATKSLPTASKSSSSSNNNNNAKYKTPNNRIRNRLPDTSPGGDDDLPIGGDDLNEEITVGDDKGIHNDSRALQVENEILVAVDQFVKVTSTDKSTANDYITKYTNVGDAVTAYYDNNGKNTGKSGGTSGKGIKISSRGGAGIDSNNNVGTSNNYTRKEFMDLLTDGRIYPRGLVNIGNTCFSGSVLQLIGANPLVREYFRNDDYLHHIIAEGRLGSEGRLVIRHVAEVIRMMWYNTDDDSHQMSNFNRHPPALRTALEDLRTQISRRYSRFGAGQHDISEYEKVLTEILHEDTNRALHNNPNIEQKVYTNHHPKTRDETFMTAANRTLLAQQHLDNSPYRNIFLSQLASCKTCSNCNHTSISFSTDTSIDVSIPPQHDNGQAFSLMECINNTWNDGSFCEYTCDACQHTGNVTSQTYLASTPHAIIVHIKRYTDNNLDQIGESRNRDPLDYNANQQRRVNNLIQCPMILSTQSLLHPEVDPSPSDDKVLYQLVATAKQIPDNDYPNDITQGHYISYVMANDSKWYECNDHHYVDEVEKENISEVVGPNTVALHYIRKDLASEEPYLVNAFNDAQAYESQIGNNGQANRGSLTNQSEVRYNMCLCMC